jgi:hypothetical protein
VHHHHDQPLRNDLAVGSPELTDIGVHRQLLPGCEDVGVDDGRNDDRSTVDLLGRAHDRGVGSEELDAVDEHLVPVGVGLPEVVGPAGQHRLRLVPPSEAAAGPNEVGSGVVPLDELWREVGLEALAAVLAIGTEPAPQIEQPVGLVVGDERIEEHHRSHGRTVNASLASQS